MKKICYIVPRYHPDIGGTEKLCEEVLETINKNNSNITSSVITTPNLSREKSVYNYKIFDCPFNQFPLMKEHFEIFNYDLAVFFADLHTPFLNAYNTSWAKKNICVLNLDERTYDWKDSFIPAIQNLRKFDMVVTFTKNGIANKFLEENKIKNTYIPNFSRDVLATVKETDYIEKLGLDKNKKTILYNAAYEERKNQLTVVNHILNSKKLQSYNWIFIGAVADENYLRKCILSTKDIKNIRFLKASSNIKIVDQLYQQTDCTLLCSIAEGMPLVLLESMSANKPIVSTPVGGVSGVLKNVCDIHILSSINFSTFELENSLEKQINSNFNYREIWNKMFHKQLVCEQYNQLFKDLI